MRLIDLHCDTVSKLAKPWHRGTLLKNPYAVDLTRLEKADALVQCFSMYFFTGAYPARLREPIAFRLANHMLDVYEKNLRLCGERVLPIRGYADIERCRTRGLVGAMATLEDGVPIGDSLDKLQHFYDRGIRLITLTWNYENAIGYPNADVKGQKRGLKTFGLELLEEMNRLGILVDVSHLSDGGFWDVVRHSKKPFLASHSNARTVTDHPRNMTDEMIRATAEKGGVIGLNLCPNFLGDDGTGRISYMLRHIRHIYDVGGADVLAIGTDFDGITGKFEIHGTQDIHLLAEALRKHKMSERILEKMWSGNALRVFRDVLQP